jgi:hypothetical protein
MLVANPSAATKAGDVLQEFPMLGRIPVDRLDLRPAFLGEGRELACCHRL